MNITTAFGQRLEITETPAGLVASRGILTYKEEIPEDDVMLMLAVDPLPGEVLLTEQFYETDRYGRPRLHRTNGPAETRYYSDGSVRTETWYTDGYVQRLDGPAVIEYVKGKVSRLDTRSLEQRLKDGAVDSVEWHLKSGKGRQDGPAETFYHDDGSIAEEYWYLDNIRFRESGGPLEVFYYKGEVFPGDTEATKRRISGEDDYDSFGDFSDTDDEGFYEDDQDDEGFSDTDDEDLGDLYTEFQRNLLYDDREYE